MADGSIVEMRAGGDGPYVSRHFLNAQSYAKPKTRCPRPRSS
jgi:hypothetical protein